MDCRDKDGLKLKPQLLEFGNKKCFGDAVTMKNPPCIIHRYVNKCFTRVKQHLLSARQRLIKPTTSIIEFVVKKTHLKRKLDTDQERSAHTHMQHMY